MKKVSLIAASCLAGLVVCAADSVVEPQPPASKAQTDQVLNFAMLDYRGKFYELKRADATVVVLFFTGNGCPIARQSISKIRSLRSKFAKDGAVFWMVNANSQDDRQSIAEEAEEFKVGSVPILKDDTQGLARCLGVTRTAEAIAIDTKNLSIIYRGAVDDQLTEGAKKPAPAEKYLETALAEFFAGKPVTRQELLFPAAASSSKPMISKARFPTPKKSPRCWSTNV
jgi:peroxiredoxin